MFRSNKIIYILIFVLTVLIIQCKENESNFLTEAVITGPDPRDCICCGGYFIEINDSTYNFDQLPSSCNLDLMSAEFPIAVFVDWEPEKKCGDIQYITIKQIEVKSH